MAAAAAAGRQPALATIAATPTPNDAAAITQASRGESRPAAIGREAVRFIRRSVDRSRIWLATLELAATSAVPSSSTTAAPACSGRPPVSHIEVTTVASTITAIRGLVRLERSAAHKAEPETAATRSTVPQARVDDGTSSTLTGGGVMRRPFPRRRYRPHRGG